MQYFLFFYIYFIPTSHKFSEAPHKIVLGFEIFTSFDLFLRPEKANQIIWHARQRYDNRK